MYENKDYETILEGMEARVDSSINKGEGTLVNFALAPAAAELEEVYNDLEAADLNGSSLTCDREHLIVFGRDNNIPIKTATNAIWLAEFNVDFDVGERFEAGDLTYVSIKKVSEGKYPLQCETAGREGNRKPDDELLPIEFIDDYETGELTELIQEAADDEDTEIYRARYLEKRRQEYSMSGNKASYKRLFKNLAGVGGVKMERVTRERKRINAFILSATWGKPDDNLVSAIQQEIDPVGSQGDGEGAAPWWHVVDVYPVDTVVINIKAAFELVTGVAYDDILSDLEAAIDNYYMELNKTWENTQQGGLIVRALKIAEAMADVEGIVDIKNLLLNDIDDNITLARNAIPVRGVIENVN